MPEAARKTSYRTYANAAYEPDYVPSYGDSAVQAPRPGRGGQPRVLPRVLPRERPMVRPKVHLRPAGHVAPFAVVGFLAVAAVAALVLLSYTKLTVLSDQVVSLRNQYTALKSEEAKLLAQYELAFDLKSIETAVTADGRMVKPQSSQIYYMDLSGSDSVVVYEDETAATLGETVKGLLDRVAEYLP